MRSQELQRSHMATVRALSNAVEARDAYTAKHAERVTAYGLMIARAVSVPLAGSTEIEFGFLMHEIGKLALSDAILYKPGPITPQERAQMSIYPVIRAEIIGGIEFLAGARQVVRHHHERWDGRGYPDGLAEEIPLAARVFAVADVLDALTTGRPYRSASMLPVARGMIRAESGRHFDPGRHRVRAPRGRRRPAGAGGGAPGAARARVPRRGHCRAWMASTPAAACGRCPPRRRPRS